MGTQGGKYRQAGFHTHPQNRDQLKQHDLLLVGRTALFGVLDLRTQQLQILASHWKSEPSLLSIKRWGFRWRPTRKGVNPRSGSSLRDY